MDPKERIETLASSKVGYLKKRMGQEGEAEPQLTADPQNVDAILGDWPDTPKKVATKMTEQYGPPHEVTPTRLIWHRNGPWKRSILFRDEIPTTFPPGTPTFSSSTWITECQSTSSTTWPPSTEA